MIIAPPADPRCLTTQQLAADLCIVGGGMAGVCATLTAAHNVEKSDPDTIAAVRAFCSQNSTMYEIRAPLFCDASGDGVVAFRIVR